ncbi:MAG: DUF1501 domain-containing protein, partial [Actinomycetota bacterium]
PPGGGATGRLVVVFLRGAADHLSITVPLDDADYHDARPSIAIDADDTLPLDDRFGFHPALERLHERYRAGRLAPVVAVGNPAADRSHFLAQDLLERGSAGADDDVVGGWLARHLNLAGGSGAAGAVDGGLRAVTIGGNVDASLLGFPALGMLSLDAFGLAGVGQAADALERTMLAAHGGDSTVDVAAQAALDAARQVADLPASTAGNPTTAAFADAVTLLDADLGVEVITLNIDGWDTHDNMGTAETGQMRTLLTGLDDAVGGLLDGLDQRGLDDVTTLVVTEFGRRVTENGSGGCDHGWASAALVAGPAVDGGRVFGDWPGLSADVVGEANGDVLLTTDYRQVYGELLTGVLGGDHAQVFPDLAARPLGLLR